MDIVYVRSIERTMVGAGALGNKADARALRLGAPTKIIIECDPDEVEIGDDGRVRLLVKYAASYGHKVGEENIGYLKGDD